MPGGAFLGTFARRAGGSALELGLGAGVGEAGAGTGGEEGMFCEITGAGAGLGISALGSDGALPSIVGTEPAVAAP